MIDDPQVRIDAYLHRLRRALRRLPEAEVQDVVQELRSHIVERASASGELTRDAVERTLIALGDPERLAREYLVDNLLARAEVSRSPWLIVRSLFGWASLSVAGFFVLVGALLGYFIGGAFYLCALLKPFHPQTAGLWRLPSAPDQIDLSLRLGFGTVPEGGHELLGWWIVPIGLAMGCALAILTSRVALWCARAYRRPQAVSQADEA